MRRSSLRELAGHTREEDPTDVARELLVENFGPRTAAWLVGKHRAQLHRRGAVDFVVPDPLTDKRSEELRWFFVAIECLKRRPGWGVEVLTHQGKRRFRVRWHSWPHWGAQRGLGA